MKNKEQTNACYGCFGAANGDCDECAKDWSDKQWNGVQTHAGVLQRSSRTKKNIMLLWQNIHLIGRQARSFIDQHTRQES